MRNEAQPFVDSENPYLYDASGPKQRSMFVDPIINEEDESNMYSVQFENEKFSLNPSALKPNETPEQREERELAEALEQIRRMESQEAGSQAKQSEKKSKEELKEDYMAIGGDVYELYSVLVH